MNASDPVIHSDPETMGGTPVFVGTRVPVQNLFDYLAGGHDLAEFLDDFPTVSEDQAVIAFRMSQDFLERQAIDMRSRHARAA
jgi:uncharacterized protein (DUF433 family)